MAHSKSFNKKFLFHGKHRPQTSNALREKMPSKLPILFQNLAKIYLVTWMDVINNILTLILYINGYEKKLFLICYMEINHCK